MTTPDHDKMLERVRALLTKAEGTEYPAEAEALTAKATELMAKFGIDAAMAAQRSPQREQVTRVRVKIDNPFSREKACLLSWIAEAYRCSPVLHNIDRRVSAVTVFGFPSDLELVDVLYTSLLLQATRGVARADVPVNAHTASYRRSWLWGFANAIADRLKRANQQAESQASEPGVALVLADRGALVASAKANAFPNLAKGPRRPTLTGLGESDGMAAGRVADIGSPKLGGERGQLDGSTLDAPVARG